MLRRHLFGFVATLFAGVTSRLSAKASPLQSGKGLPWSDPLHLGRFKPVYQDQDLRACLWGRRADGQIFYSNIRVDAERWKELSFQGQLNYLQALLLNCQITLEELRRTVALKFSVSRETWLTFIDRDS